MNPTDQMHSSGPGARLSWSHTPYFIFPET
jgi:hypothetical protein